MNLKGHTSSSSRINLSKTLRKVHVVISLRSGQEIDSQVENSKELYKYPNRFFQKFSPSFSSSPEAGSSSNWGDIIDGIPFGPSNDPLLSNSPSDKEETKEKNSADSVDP